MTMSSARSQRGAALALALHVILLAVVARHGIRRTDSLLLGAGLGFLAPLATILVVTYVAPWFLEEFAGWGGTDLPLPSSLVADLLNTPFGCLGGWVVWRMGFPSEWRADVDDGRLTRLGSSLGMRRGAFRVLNAF